MERQALAVKYRPVKFEEVCEQASTITILKNQLATQTFKHAYLFTGPAGCGKTTCARIFAKEINGGCGNPIEMDAASHSGVDDVRKIISQAQTKALDSEFKVFIIDECHAISNTGWQAFLKLIEEPPAKSIFIFCTTDPQKIPNTILSRVQRFSFNRISSIAIYENLVKIAKYEEIKLSTEMLSALKFIANISDGGMRDAITLMDKCLSYTQELTVDIVNNILGYIPQAEIFSFLQLLSRNEIESALNFIQDIYQRGVDVKRFINQLYRTVLDMLVWSYTGTSTFCNCEEAGVAEWMLNSGNIDCWIQLLDSINTLKGEIKWVNNPKAEVEAWIILS